MFKNRERLVSINRWLVVLWVLSAVASLVIVSSRNTMAQSSTTVEYRITDGADDVEENANGSMYSTSTDIELVNDGGRGDQTIGLRFQTVNVPQGATITNAYLEFVADESQTTATDLTVYGNDVDSASAFTSAANNVSSRAKTSAAVNWNNVSSWAIGNTYQSPDISTIVQELVDRSGWDSSSTMMFMIDGTGHRTAESANSPTAASQAPLLHIEYTVEQSTGETTHPWQASASDPYRVDLPWNYAMGYVFTPNVDGRVTHLGGLFNGTKIVKLFDASTNALLAEASVTASNDWGYTQITDFEVTAGTEYRVVVYLAGSGGSYQKSVAYPVDSNNITILRTLFVSTSTDPNKVPTASNERPDLQYMYGQPDIGFVADGVVTPTPTPEPSSSDYPWQSNASTPYRYNMPWSNYAMGYKFTPKMDGYVTHLGGLFNNTETVKLFDASTNALLAEASVTASNEWGYAEIADTAVEAGNEYRVVVYLTGISPNGSGSYQKNVSFPVDSTHVTILNTILFSTGGDPNAVPQATHDRPDLNSMYGQADIGFRPEGGEETPVGLLNNYGTPLSYGDTFDGGAPTNEFSGVTFNQSNSRLVMVADNAASAYPDSGKSHLYEYANGLNLDENSTPLSARVINIASDVEGIVWMYDDTYAIMSEDDGLIYVVNLDANPSNAINTSLYTIDTGLGGSGNKGAEGVAFEIGSATASNPNNPIFYVVKEQDGTTLHKMGKNGQIGNDITIATLIDLSDVYYAEANTSLYIVSDQSNTIIQIDAEALDWSSVGTTVQSSSFVSTLTLPTSFKQVEGITFNDDLSTMIIVSETKDFGGDSFGQFTAE